MNEERQQVRAVVHGRVQGVNFRQYTVREAYRLGVQGWVRNRADNTVEVFAEGTREQLEQLIAFLQLGSPQSQVSHVNAVWSAAQGDVRGFDVRYGDH